jgi:hypothetical protein
MPGGFARRLLSARSIKDFPVPAPSSSEPGGPAPPPPAQYFPGERRGPRWSEHNIRRLLGRDPKQAARARPERRALDLAPGVLKRPVAGSAPSRHVLGGFGPPLRRPGSNPTAVAPRRCKLQFLATADGQLQLWQIAYTGRHLVQHRCCVGELLTHLRIFSAHPFECGLFHSMSHLQPGLIVPGLFERLVTGGRVGCSLRTLLCKRGRRG